MKEIQRDTKYWLIRPGVGAKCFEDFYRDNCIAIGWDKIEKISDGDNITSLDGLKELVRIQYGEILSEGRKSINRKVGDIASKIYRFTYEVKENDIIITPGDTEVLIGRVVGELEIVKGLYNTKPTSKDEELIGELNKVRKVVWLDRIKREKLEPHIKLELRVVHGISLISNEQVITEINRTIYSLYEYNNVGHSIYRIKSEEEIDFEKYAKFIQGINEIYSIYRKNEQERLYIKSNIQSPGPIELIGSMDTIVKITAISKYIFKKEKIDQNILMPHKEAIEQLRSQYEDDDYTDYDFPCGGII